MKTDLQMEYAQNNLSEVTSSHTLKRGASNGFYELVEPNIVPDSTIRAFKEEGLTVSPQALGLA